MRLKNWEKLSIFSTHKPQERLTLGNWSQPCKVWDSNPRTQQSSTWSLILNLREGKLISRSSWMPSHRNWETNNPELVLTGFSISSMMIELVPSTLITSEGWLRSWEKLWMGANWKKCFRELLQMAEKLQERISIILWPKDPSEPICKPMISMLSFLKFVF